MDLIRLRTKHKLLALKDALQNAALSGAVHRDNKLFSFLGSMIEGVADHLPEFNLYSVLASSFIAAPSSSYERISAEFDEPPNSRYKAVLEGFVRCVIEFQQQQHGTITFLAKGSARIFGKIQEENLEKELKYRDQRIAFHRAAAREKRFYGADQGNVNKSRTLQM